MAFKRWKRKVVEGILKFADDPAVVMTDKDNMQYMLRKLIEEYNAWKLNVNTAKTKHICIGKQRENLYLGKSGPIRYFGI